LGGNHVAFIKHYAKTALRIIRDPRNRSAMKLLPEKSRHMLLIEQYMLTACVEYHRTQRSRFGGIEIRHVFPTIDEAMSPRGPREAGFTHLAAGAKRNPRVSRHLQTRVQNELPEFYERSTSFLPANPA
jgi:hypothetical protein